MTQLFYDNDDYFRYVEDVRAHRRRGADRAGHDAHPVLRPVPADRDDVRLADPGRARGAPGEGRGQQRRALQLGIDYTTEQCEALLDYGVPGFHFYSLNKARGVSSVFENLQLQTLATAG